MNSDLSTPWWSVISGRTPTKAHEKFHASPSTSTDKCACAGQCTKFTNILMVEDDWTRPSGSTPKRAYDKPPPFVMCRDSVKPSGRIPYLKKMPEIIPIVDDFIRDCGVAADRRRQDKPGVYGARSKDIANHINAVVPKLRITKQQVGISFARRLLMAPHKGRKVAVLYDDKVKAKKAQKRNTLRSTKEDSHRYSALVKLATEFTNKYGGNIISVDNKNKVPVGLPADGRRASNKMFYPENDAPNCADHDWPLKDYKIIPMGYLFLTPPPDLTPKLDKLGRPYIDVIKSGKLYIRARASMFITSTIEHHVNDLIDLIPRELGNPTVVTIVADNGPDWSTRTLVNIVMLVRLFQQLNLDALLIVSYCPGESAYNAIEHSWCPCTICVANLVLSAVLPGELLPPCLQKLSEKERREKEAQVLTQAMKIYCNQISNRAQFGGHPVQASYEACNKPEGRYSDYAKLQATLSSRKQTKENPRLMNLLSFARAHLNRNYDCLVFTKCQSRDCWHCFTRPVRNTQAMEFLRKNPSFPCPIPDEDNPGHFARFLQVDSDDERYRLTLSEPDTFMPKYQTLRKKIGVARCLKCRFTFRTASEKRVHYSLFHMKNRIKK